MSPRKAILYGGHDYKSSRFNLQLSFQTIHHITSTEVLLDSASDYTYWSVERVDTLVFVDLVASLRNTNVAQILLLKDLHSNVHVS